MTGWISRLMSFWMTCLSVLYSELESKQLFKGEKAKKKRRSDSSA